MPVLSSDFTFVPVDDIWVDRGRRQRQSIEADSGLLTSIARRGILNPLLLRRNPSPTGVPYELIAGERRLIAAVSLELDVVPARMIESLSRLELSVVELEENIKRQDISWQEFAKASKTIHELRQLTDAATTISSTADYLGLSEPFLSIQLKVAKYFGDSTVDSAATLREAHGYILRREARATGAALDELRQEVAEPIAAPAPVAAGFSPPPLPALDAKATEHVDSRRIAPSATSLTLPQALASSLPTPIRRESPVLCGDFIAWAGAYSGPKFNLIHCDFPYGVNVFGGQMGREGSNAINHNPAGYEDSSPAVFTRLLSAFIDHHERFFSISGHLVFWYSEKVMPFDVLRQTLESAVTGLVVSPHPLIWMKTDNAGIAPNPKHDPRHIYETALFATRGDRPIVKVMSDAYGAPSDRTLHPSTKPEPMLRHFFSMLVDDYTSILDPTCGSGSSLRAAESLGAKTLLGIELSPEWAKTAEASLRHARAKRLAATMEIPT